MASNLDSNINILHRKLVELKDAITLSKVSRGQAKFIEVYMDVALEHLNKSLDILDKEVYEEMLMELDI